MPKFKKICLIIAALYFLANLLLLLNHEAYSDEVNQWLIAKNASLFDLPQILITEGHPPLWYLILIPFAKLGFPFITANIISLIIMTIAVYLLARHSPFRLLTVILIVASGLFTYFLPVFARNYQIAVLGAVLLCIFYKNRLKKPIQYGTSLALLAQSHILVIGFAAAIGIVWALELIRKKPKQRAKTSLCIIGAGIALLSGIIAILPIIGTLGTHGYLRISDNNNVYAEFNSIGGYLGTLDASLFGIRFTNFIFTALLIWALVYFLTRGKPKQFFFLIAGVGFQAATLAYIYAFTKHQQDVLLLLMLLVVWWTGLSDKSHSPMLTKAYSKILHFFRKSELVKLLTRRHINSNIIFGAIFALTIPNTFYWAIRDLLGEFSIAPAAASKINDIVPENSTLVIANGHIDTLALIPHLNPSYKIWDLHFKRELQYMVYDRQSTAWLNAEELKSAVKDQLPNRKNIYYVSPTCITNFEDPAASYLDTLNQLMITRNENVGDDKITTERCFALYDLN